MFWRGGLKWGSACGQHGGTACGGSKKSWALPDVFRQHGVFAKEYAAGGRRIRLEGVESVKDALRLVSK